VNIMPNKRNPETGEFPSEVKPHGRFRRFRQKMPSAFKPHSFHTKKLPGGTELVMGKSKATGKMEVQSILKPIKSRGKQRHAKAKPVHHHGGKHR
jgi:hypothetical protein